MTMFHAVVWIDHQNAQVLQFDAEHVQAQKVKAHTHHTAQHGSNVRTGHEFFGEVCDALAGITEVLVVGPKTGITDFEHYIAKHRTAVTKQVVGYDVVDHPSENQLVALARKYFLKYDRMNGVPTPT
jgi:stalled ribosome rescue protein Dom34